jgi:hypothetical protein
MYKHNYGTKSAEFFVYWALVLEKIENFEKVEQVIGYALKNQAKPISFLESFISDFRQRCQEKEEIKLR